MELLVYVSIVAKQNLLKLVSWFKKSYTMKLCQISLSVKKIMKHVEKHELDTWKMTP